MTWTSPKDLHHQLQRYWQRGDILRARLGEPLFPLRLQLRKPAARDLTERFAEVADWVGALRRSSQAERGFGYRIHWRQRRHRVQGSNALPDAITVDTEQDALRWLGCQAQAASFSRLTTQTLDQFPELHPWLLKHPLRALRHEVEWHQVLAVLGAFRASPRPGVYLRELDIPGVHSKFIETHRGLLAQLLDEVLPATAIDGAASGLRGFNQRYGLRDKPVRVRMRLLDQRLAIKGLTDLTVPVAQLAEWDPGAQTVFVTENEINGLAFPEMPNALVIFGLGYGVKVLSRLSWLASRRLYYWGDIDTHGFAILDRFRQVFPAVQSLLMDEATLMAHQSAWGEEGRQQRFVDDLDHLTDSEQVLYEILRSDRLAPNLRLEQEHLRQSWLLDALSRL